MADATTVRKPEQVQRRTWFLLWCERCGHADEPPPNFDPPYFTAPSTEPMKCNDCGEHLHLIECFTAPESVTWQKAPGHPWQSVVYPDRLPDVTYRQRWMHP